jgi:antitoxin YefM
MIAVTSAPAPAATAVQRQPVDLSGYWYKSLVCCRIHSDTSEREQAMRTVSFTDARNGLKSVLDGVVGDADIAIITRRDAEDAVVMSLDYYNSLMETVHLLKSPANAAHLAESIEQYRAGKVFERATVAEHQ